ncbi:MAG: DNA topoisomerase I [Candidatus Aenigmarchaeota archaeon]|nr:DNA topoisomerase I [Candidatus Aenigmarchaeota archaeon]
MPVLILAEKPTAAKAIAKALGQPKENETDQGVKWYEFTRSGKKHIVVAAVGHLFTLKYKKGTKGYPIFDLEWVPTWSASKFGAFSKRYFDAIAAVAGKADDVIIATDYDTEGEVIGFNILRFMLGREDGKRMKFSTMTEEELQESYDNAAKHINKGQAEAGMTRHYLDYMWGVSLSRALMNAIKTAGRRFRILSTGRVQAPTLHMLVKREHQIKAFKPKPFWQVEAHVKIGKENLKAQYEKDKIWNKDEAEAVLRSVKKKAAVKEIRKRQIMQQAPKPFNTTSFLTEVYRHCGYSPAKAMSIAEALYQAGLISYPRTSSEKLPKDINYRKIIGDMQKQAKYAGSAKKLLAKKELKPNEGSRTDPAHPAIYSTGKAGKLGEHQQRVYDLVARRFLATFGDPAKRETQRIILDIDGHNFSLSGVRTLEPGWTELYGKYAAREEILLPDVKEGDVFAVEGAGMFDKKTQPPARYSQGSVIKEMEERGLGTKATRAQILQILYNRGYVLGNSIEVTDLGMKITDVLEKYASDIVSEKLTRHFEEETESVVAGKANMDEVLNEGKNEITKLCAQLQKKEKIIGKALTDAIIEAQEKQSILGKCPKCGGNAKMFRLWHTHKRFAGCSNYPKCDFSAPLPAQGFIRALEKICDQCKSPMIQVQREGGRPFRMCLDIHCPTKKDWFDKKKLVSVIAREKLQKKEKKAAKGS